MSNLKNVSGPKSGFTLLEMLLVIAIIAILASIVIVAINPAKQIADANNAQRRSDVLAILNAVHQYMIDNDGSDAALNDGNGLPTTGGCDEDNYVCDGDSCTGVDLHSLLVDVEATSYLTAIPIDPLQSASTTLVSDNHSGYAIEQDSTSGRITVCAPLAENDQTISVTR